MGEERFKVKRKPRIPRFNLKRPKKGPQLNKTDPKAEHWKRKPKGRFASDVKLYIDARMSSIPRLRRNLTHKQKMLKVYNPKSYPQGVNFFVPSIPVKKHPQLQKIETYFVKYL